MPSVYDLKPRFQNLLRPLMRWLAAAGLTPNAVTLMALVGSILVGALVSQAGKRPLLHPAHRPSWNYRRKQSP